MLLTSEYKYIYSAADRQEWLFRRLSGRLDERSLVGNPAYGRILNDYRKRLIEWAPRGRLRVYHLMAINGANSLHLLNLKIRMRVNFSKTVAL